MSRAALKMGGREWALLLVLSFLWGGSFFFFKVLARELPPFTIAFGRVALAALALNAVLLLRRDALPASPCLWAAFAVMGALNNAVPFTLIAWGEARISSGLASILNATTPIFTVIAAHFATANERLDWGKGAGVLLGFGGAAALIGPETIAGSVQDIAGAAACLGAALSYACAGIYGRRFTGLAPLKVAAGQITASALLLLPFAALADRVWALPPPSAAAWGALLGISLVSTALAYMIYFRILAAAGATNLLLVTFLLPGSALALGVLVLGERVAPNAMIGLALIGLGLAGIDGRPARALLRRLGPGERAARPQS